MKKISLLIIISAAISSFVLAQPTYSVDPAVFTAEDEITISVNVTGTSLANYNGNVWMWAWIAEGCPSNCDAPSNINPAGAAASDALMTRDPNNGNVYSITFVLTEFFNRSPAEIQKFGFKLKSQDWGDGKQSDNDIVLTVQSLIFTPQLSRTFPSKATQHDVVTLYLDQKLATTPALKYELSDFEVEIQAFNENNDEEGALVKKAAVNQGNGVHYVRIIPSYNFNSNNLNHIQYRFISKDDAEVRSEWFEVLFLDLN